MGVSRPASIQAAEPPPRVIGRAGEREGVDLVLGDEGRARLAARSRRADGERLRLRDASFGEDRLAVEMREVAGEGGRTDRRAAAPSRPIATGT